MSTIDYFEAFLTALLIMGVLAGGGYSIYETKKWIDKQKKQITSLSSNLQFAQQRFSQEQQEKKIQEIELERLRNQLNQSEISDIANTKKKKFMYIPNISFHFADKEQIESFCNDYFKEPTLENLVAEISGEVNAQLKSGIPSLVESKIGGKDVAKWISTIKIPDASLNGAFLRYQREIIKSGQVSLGIEEVDIELTDLQEFDDAIKNLSQRYEFQVSSELLDKQRKKLKQKAAEKTIQKLESVTGWVLIEGNFKIELQDDFYKCTYTHPVNDYISQKESVTISIIIPADSLESHVAGNYKQSIGQLIPLKVYGQVWHPINRKTATWELKLTPLAIYQ